MMVMAEILYCIFNVLGWIFTELNVYGVLVALLLVPLCVQVACISETTLYRVLLFLFLFSPWSRSLSVPVSNWFCVELLEGHSI